MGRVFVERERLVEAAEGLIDAVVAGRGGTLVVVGGAGLGKTTALRICCERASVAGLDVGVGRAVAAEASLPYGLLDQALAAIGASAPADAPPPPGALGADDGRRAAAARAARFHATLRTLAARGGRRPALLVFDDLHWADEDSLALIGFLARRIGDQRIGLVTTVRPWPDGPHAGAVELVSEGVATIVPLEPLSLAGTEAVMVGALGERATADVAAAHRLTRGNPLLVEQVTARLGQGEAIDGLMADGADDRRLVLARVARVSEPTLHLLRAAAVAGVRFRPALVGQACGLDGPGVIAALDEACRAELVRSSEPGWAEFSHPLAQFLCDDVPGPVQAQLHAGLFRALVAAGHDTAEAAGVALRADLTGDPTAVGVLERAGVQALRAGSLADAVKFLQGAVACAGDAASPTTRLALAQLRIARGDVATAAQELAALIDDVDGGGAVELPARRALAEALCLGGRSDAAEQRSLETADRMTDTDPAAAAEVLLEHAYTVFRVAGPARALPIAARARVLAATGPEQARRNADARWGYLALLCGDGDGDAAAVVDAAASVTAASAGGTWFAPGATSRAMAYANSARLQERWADAEATYRALSADLAGPAGVVTGSYATALLASMLAALGRFDEALALAEAAGDMGETLPMVHPIACAASAEAELHLGNIDAARRTAEIGRRSVERSGDWCAGLRLLAITARLHALTGHVDEASSTYLEVEALNDRLGIAEPCFVPWARDAVLAHLRAGRPSDAERVAAWVEMRAAASRCSWPRIAALGARAALAEAGDDFAGAAALHTRAVAAHARAGLPLERIRTLLDAGAFARRRGSPVQARRLLADALRSAEALGAATLGREAAAELAAASGRRRAQHAADVLTEQEARVARLAAAGCTNVEIGRQLFISAKTVESHLRHVYAKLQVKGRRDLIGKPWLVPDGAPV